MFNFFKNSQSAKTGGINKSKPDPEKPRDKKLEIAQRIADIKQAVTAKRGGNPT